MQKIYCIKSLEMGPHSHPKVVPRDQFFFLQKSPLYIMYFRHMNREHFQKRPKTGKPAAHRFRIIKIRFLGIFRYILATQHFGFSFQKRRPGLMYLSLTSKRIRSDVKVQFKSNDQKTVTVSFCFLRLVEDIK